MATREDFAEVEWAVICDAAHSAAFAMMLVGHSGLFGSMKEMLVAGKTAAAGLASDSELVRAICQPEAMGLMRERLTEAMTEAEGMDPREVLAGKAVEWLREALPIVKKKAPEDAEAYQRWVLESAETMANASKEGGFLGIGGERVSPAEAALLAALRAAVAL
jgi:hypothetical protein